MAWCNTQDVPGLHYETWILGSWLLALLLGATLVLLGRRHGRSPWIAVGVAVMSIPAWMALLPVLPDMVKTFCEQGNVGLVVEQHGTPSAPSAAQFLSSAVDALERNVGYIAVGALLFLHGRQGEGSTATSLSEKLAQLAPMGRSTAASITTGAALFPFLALLNIVLVAAIHLALRATGANSYFANMTATSAFALALAAGLGEELVYRGVMQQGLKRALASFVPNRFVAAGLAIVLQSIPFAYAHAGYGEPKLLLFNAGFALLAGVAVECLGMGAAIVLHFLIDFFAFFLQNPAPDSVFWAVALAMAAAVVAASVMRLVQILPRLQRTTD